MPEEHPPRRANEVGDLVDLASNAAASVFHHVTPMEGLTGRTIRIVRPGLGFVRSGALLCRLEGKQVVLGPGSVLVAKVGDELEVVDCLSSPWTTTSFVPGPELMDEVLQRYGVFDHEQGRPVLPTGTLSPALGLHSRVPVAISRLPVAAARSVDIGDRDLVSLLEDSLAVLRSRGDLIRGGIGRAEGAEPRADCEDPPGLRYVRRALARIFADPSAGHRLEDLSAAAGCSPYYLSRLFRRHLGATVHQTLVQTRLSVALERLLQEEVSLTDLALELGFSSHSHFSLAFRRSVGVPPSRYRELVA